MKQNSHPIGTVMFGGEPKLTIRIIRRCNFRCPSCSTFSNPQQKGIISFADFKKAIDILVQERFHGVLNISGGEPTLHPKINEILTYASKQLANARIVLFTNGNWVSLPYWRQKLKLLLVGSNIIVRFSLDRQHAEGAALAIKGYIDESYVKEIEKIRLNKAHIFRNACLEEGAIPCKNFDFAFKGCANEAKKYMSGLGEVPLYLIKFQKDPANRPKKYGYFALDINENNKVLVYPTLGSIPAGESLGGIDHLSLALRMNRKAIMTKKCI